MTVIRSLVRKSIKSDDICKAFSLFWDGGFDLDLTSAGIQLWGVKDTTMKGWENTSPVDNPVSFLDAKFSTIGHDLEFDMVICNDRIKQYDVARDLAYKFHLPIIIIDHSLPENLNATDIMVINKTRKCAFSVGCHPTITKKWQCDFTIPYGIEVPDLNNERTNDVLIHGSFLKLVPEHQVIIQQIQEESNAVLYGYAETNSNPFTSWKQCKNIFDSSKIFINLSTTFAFPRGLLLAMAHGCAVITNEINLTKEIINHRKNCLKFDKIEEILPKVKELLSNNALRLELAVNAQQTIKDNFPMQQFREQWQKLIPTIRETLYLL